MKLLQEPEEIKRSPERSLANESKPPTVFQYGGLGADECPPITHRCGILGLSHIRSGRNQQELGWIREGQKFQPASFFCPVGARFLRGKVGKGHQHKRLVCDLQDNGKGDENNDHQFQYLHAAAAGLI
jgi:hypothetical protein